MRKTFALLFLFGACSSQAPEGLRKAPAAATTVKMDLFHKPLPEIPLPNDIATRHDPSSATGRRINASMIASTGLERIVREKIDELDGWGTFQPITIPFTGPLDVSSILEGHRDANYDLKNDVVYVVNVDPRSPELGKVHHLDIGGGAYPVVLEKRGYWKNDPRGDSLSLLYEDADEDLNHNGRLDPGEDVNMNQTLDPGEDTDGDGQLDPPEDSDADGVLDTPNYLPDHAPAADDLAGRADALMSFYEKETNTLVARLLVPLRERTTYAVVVTRRLRDANGDPVGSPFEFVNHTAQTEALRPLLQHLPDGLAPEDIAFAYSFSTQTIEAGWKALREGLYGYGVQKHLGEEYPPDITNLEKLRDTQLVPDLANPYIMYSENWIKELADVYEQTFGLDRDTEQFKALEASHQYIDYHVLGSFDSPQLFRREDGEGRPLRFDEQVWPEDLDRVPAPARSEKVYFWLTVPRKEVSARGAGKPAPVVILGHGYTSNRLEIMYFGSFFAKQGIATIAIDCVSHGAPTNALLESAIKGILGPRGLQPFADAALKDRATDMNGDFTKDSGADFWTSYIFHTRDLVRQSALDYMQLARIVRSFDGTRRLPLDLNGDGKTELAGDFDADGVVDVGGPEVILGATGGSLGGIMSTVLGAIEPAVDVVVPIAGGGGLSDIGVRSQQGGVREAVVLRLISPAITATFDAASGNTKVEMIVADLNRSAELEIASVSRVRPGDTMIVENLTAGERACAYLDGAGQARAPIKTDAQDALRVSFYSGPALVLGDEHCTLVPGAISLGAIEQFQSRVGFQGREWFPGDRLVSPVDGYGLHRARPELRRMMGIAQMVLDPADPAVLAPHFQLDPIRYERGGVVEESGAHALLVTTVGDMNVPASSGVTVGRAAGYIGYLENDARYGRSANQVLIDTYTVEAVNTLGRYKSPSGEGVHLDIENFSGGADMFGTDVPRLETPIRLMAKDRLGGYSGSIFPYAIPTGQHGFPMPGEMIDRVRKACARECTSEDGCGCAQKTTWDTGFFMFNFLGRYLVSGAQEIDLSACNAYENCDDQMPMPAAREAGVLR